MLKSLLSKRHGDKTSICNRRPGVNCRENACSKRLIKQGIWEWRSILSETRSWRLFQGLYPKTKRSQKCDTHCLGCSRVSPRAALPGSLGQPAVGPTAPGAPRRKAWACRTEGCTLAMDLSENYWFVLQTNLSGENYLLFTQFFNGDKSQIFHIE